MTAVAPRSADPAGPRSVGSVDAGPLTGEPLAIDADHRPSAAESRSGSVHRTLAILEAVASRGGATAKEIAYSTGLPLPTVYRLARELIDSDYLVHIRQDNRFELGYKLHQLAVSLHEQIGVPRPVQAEIAALRRQLDLAAYFAIHRGSEIVVVYTSDGPNCPRLNDIKFGFHEAPHATALGKIFLADRHPARPQYATIARTGVAWERGEWQVGSSCAAAAVRGPSGTLIGSVAVSGPDARIGRARVAVEGALRATAVRVARHYTGGADACLHSPGRPASSCPRCVATG